MTISDRMLAAHFWLVASLLLVAQASPGGQIANYLPYLRSLNLVFGALSVAFGALLLGGKTQDAPG